MHTPGLERWSALHPRATVWLRLLLHPYTLFLVVSLAVWWPDGLNVGPANDGWLGLSASSFLPATFNTRTFSSFFFRALGMHLVPGGFQGWQTVLFVPTVLRGILMFEISKRLFPGHALFAVGCGLIMLFHPVDTSYFWLDSAGIAWAVLFTLAAVLSSIVHLQTGSRVSLLCMWLFQILSCFSYTAFVLVMLAVPAFVWLSRRLEGSAVGVAYLLKAGVLIFAFIVFQAALTFNGNGHEAVVMDMSLRGIVAGYVYQAGAFLRSLVPFLTPFRSGYLLIALVPGIFAYAVAASLPAMPAAGSDGVDRRPVIVTVTAVLILAGLSFLPYAVSNLRFGNAREMLAAGFFLYMLLLLPVFFLLLPRIKSGHAGFAVVAFLAVTVTVTGLTTRSTWVGVYRAQERLLAAVAAAVPNPPPGSLIVVHLDHPYQIHVLGAFENRWGTFEDALRFMYADSDLTGGFIDLYNGTPFTFDRGRVTINTPAAVNQGRSVPYGKLILVDYPGDGSARILDRSWLQHLAPPGTDLSAYSPGDYGVAPGESAITCTLLEKDLRPVYCR